MGGLFYRVYRFDRGDRVFLRGEGELEEAVGVDGEAVGVGEIVGEGVCIEGEEHLLARHFPLYLCAGHGRAAIADGGAVEGDRLPETVGGMGCCRVVLFITRERHHEVRRLICLHFDLLVGVIAVE